MSKLCCDICGGVLVMQSGGKVALCENCGMQYGVERLREKVNGSVAPAEETSSAESCQTRGSDDVAQWKVLMQKYYDSGDFQALDQIVKKILEVEPTDPDAEKMYDDLQTLKFMEIKNGVLVKYSGEAETVSIPSCITGIGLGAFAHHSELKCVAIPSSVKEIGYHAFDGTGLQQVIIPDSVTSIGTGAFHYCNSLTTVTLPSGMKYSDCRDAFMIISDDCDECDHCGSPWCLEVEKKLEEAKQVAWRKREGRCQHCGGSFSTGLFGPIKCKRCGKERDY